MVTIERIGGDPLGISQYKLKLNDKVLIPSFNHHRPDDIQALLRAAADAVTPARNKSGLNAYKRTKRS